jgi:hypothetical protein
MTPSRRHRGVLSYPCGLAISEHNAYKINAIERRG